MGAVISMTGNAGGERAARNRRAKRPLEKRKSLQLLLLAIPGILWFFIFCYLPMLGTVVAFKRYIPKKGIFGSAWCGLANFRYLFASSSAGRIVTNTIVYNFVSILAVAAVSILIALILDSVSRKAVKTYQTILFMPRFMSWVVVGYMALAFFDYEHGVLNQIALSLNKSSVSWYLVPKYWPFILIFVSVWKAMGYNALIYYGAIIGIDPEIFEAADIDGATKWQKIRRITLPLLTPTVVIMALMSVGNIMRADFGLFYYIPNNNGALYRVTDVLDTYIYRALRTSGDIAGSAATSFFQSVVGFVMVVTCNAVVKKIDSESALF